MQRARLSPNAWIEAGLAELVAIGPGALAAEPLARKLGATKGSFYWHFKDLPDYHAALLQHWQNRAFAEVLQALKEDGSAEQRLRRFGRRMLADEADAAMRVWAHADKAVAGAVAQVDEERLKYLRALLRPLGITNDDFARSTLATLIGLPQTSSGPQAIKAFDTLVDLVLALK